MTTPASGFGRLSAISPRGFSKTTRVASRYACTGLLMLCALPVWAQKAPNDSRDPLDISPGLIAPVSGAIFHNPMSLPERTLRFAKDIDTLFQSASVPGEVKPDEPQAEDAAPTEGPVKRMLKRALTLLGTPYRWGGTSPERGFDCSGLVGYVFRNSLGIELPRISRDMANVGQLILDRNALIEGDLVFFSRRGKNVDHVGIYLGNGQFVHAPRTGKDVEIANLATGYWSHKFLKARRVADSQAAAE